MAYQLIMGYKMPKFDSFVYLTLMYLFNGISTGYVLFNIGI